MHVCVLSRFSHVWLFAARWTVACQAPLSMGFSSQEYWSGLPCFLQGIVPTQASSQLGDRTQVSYLSCIDRQFLFYLRHLGGIFQVNVSQRFISFDLREWIQWKRELYYSLLMLGYKNENNLERKMENYLTRLYNQYFCNSGQ